MSVVVVFNVPQKHLERSRFFLSRGRSSLLATFRWIDSSRLFATPHIHYLRDRTDGTRCYYCGKMRSAVDSEPTFSTSCLASLRTSELSFFTCLLPIGQVVRTHEPLFRGQRHIVYHIFLSVVKGVDVIFFNFFLVSCSPFTSEGEIWYNIHHLRKRKSSK